MKKYNEKLLDPRWQRKRLEIFQRDGFRCIYCGDESSTLHVHHLIYHGDPWEVPNEYLLTVCEDCHEQEHIYRSEAEKTLIRELKLIKFSYGDVINIAAGFHAMEKFHAQDIMSSVIEWVLSDKRIMLELTERYFQHLPEKKKSNSGQIDG